MGHKENPTNIPFQIRTGEEASAYFWMGAMRDYLFTASFGSRQRRGGNRHKINSRFWVSTRGCNECVRKLSESNLSSLIILQHLFMNARIAVGVLAQWRSVSVRGLHGHQSTIQHQECPRWLNLLPRHLYFSIQEGNIQLCGNMLRPGVHMHILCSSLLIGPWGRVFRRKLRCWRGLVNRDPNLIKKERRRRYWNLRWCGFQIITCILLVPTTALLQPIFHKY